MTPEIRTLNKNGRTCIRIIPIPGTGHCVHEERADLIAKSVNALARRAFGSITQGIFEFPKNCEMATNEDAATMHFERLRVNLVHSLHCIKDFVRGRPFLGISGRKASLKRVFELVRSREVKSRFRQ